MGRTGRSGNNFRSFTFEEGQYGICFHWDYVVVANRSGADYSPFLGCKNGAKGTQMVVRNNATDTVLCGITNNKKQEDTFMRLHMIDYIGVAKNGQEAWQVRDARLSHKKFCCKSTRQSDIVEALCGWGVIPNVSGYKVVLEHGQYTVFEIKTEKPICAFFQNVR